MKDAVGQPVPRKEDLRLITGRGTYVSDLLPRRTRHVAFLRSPHAHARIGAIDASQARELAGVRAVFTGEDFRDTALRARSALPGYVETAQPVLAAGKARFAGEAVAAVVADSRYLAEDALALIDVDYAPLPVTVTAWGTEPEVPVHDEAPDNVLLTRTFAAGDAEAAFAAADLIVERELITNRHAGNPMECRAAWHCGSPSGAASPSGRAPRSRTSSGTSSPSCSACPKAASGSSRPTWAAGSASRPGCIPRTWRCAGWRGPCRARRSNGSRTAASTCWPPATPV